jgi:hypothetical protein
MKFIIKMYCESESEVIFSDKDIKDMVNENMLQYIDCAPFQVKKIEVEESDE